MIKFENILKFLTLFLSGDLKLEHQSPDYIMEKFEKYFGTEVDIIKSPCTTKLYKRHNEIWKHDDYRINSIFNFFYSVYSWSKQNDIEIDWGNSSSQAIVYHSHFNSGINNILCEPEMIVRLFEENIGKLSETHNKVVDGLHPIIKKDIYNVYFNSVEEENQKFFIKLERKEKLNKIVKDGKRKI